LTCMGDAGFSWKDPRFTYADVLTGARLLLLPYLLYALAASLTGLAAATLAAMIVTDLIDGRIARRTGQMRPFGAMLDSTVDFVVIHTLFTAFFAIGVLPWWKWLVIAVMGCVIAATQILSIQKGQALSFEPVRFGKLVGQIQFAYLPLLTVRTFWVKTGWIVTADTVLFVVLAAAIAASVGDHAGIVRRLLTAGRQEAAR